MSSEEQPAVENRSFNDVLKSLVGKMATIINPESYEAAPMGYTLKAGFYRGKVSSVGNDYLVVVTEFKKTGKDAGTEPVKQFLPLNKIKRISITKTDLMIHI